MIEKVEMGRVKTYLSIKTRISFLKISLKRDLGTAHPHRDSHPMEEAESPWPRPITSYVYLKIRFVIVLGLMQAGI